MREVLIPQGHAILLTARPTALASAATITIASTADSTATTTTTTDDDSHERLKYCYHVRRTVVFCVECAKCTIDGMACGTVVRWYV